MTMTSDSALYVVDTIGEYRNCLRPVDRVEQSKAGKTKPKAGLERRRT